MSRLLDGPAGPLTLVNARAPIFLRVTIDSAGKVDCLDQLDDEPRPDEAVHVYEKVPGTDHGPALVRLARPSTCIWMASGDYRHRPDVEGVRGNGEWCIAQPIPAGFEIAAS